MDHPEIGHAAIGAACTLLDDRGDILLVRHTYGRRNWELPGGGSRPGEAPEATARRELREETGLDVDIERLTGVYFELGRAADPMLHFVFRCRWHHDLHPVPSSAEVGDLGFWPLERLPTPISDFTELRIRDAATDRPARVIAIGPRRWR